jgi:CRP/FNR family transcriptional regulator, cyclic AMP receptor protein
MLQTRLAPQNSRKKQSGFLDQLDAALRKSYELRLRSIRVPKGRTVVEHGSTSDDVFFVIEGELRVLIYSPSGREVSVSAIGPGDMFGEFAALDGMARAATVLAVTSVTLRAMPQGDFRACLEASPAAAMWLARHLTRHIRALNNRLFELATLNVNSRLHFELLRLGLIAGVSGNAATINPAPTHTELANRIGTNREAVTRELRELARQNILCQQGRRLEIFDIAQLSAIVQRLSGQAAGVYMTPHGAEDSQSVLSSLGLAVSRR